MSAHLPILSTFIVHCFHLPKGERGLAGLCDEVYPTDPWVAADLDARGDC